MFKAGIRCCCKDANKEFEHVIRHGLGFQVASCHMLLRVASCWFGFLHGAAQPGCHNYACVLRSKTFVTASSGDSKLQWPFGVSKAGGASGLSSLKKAILGHFRWVNHLEL